MSTVLDDLLDLLRLERIEKTIFRGRSQDLGWGQVFGGQVLGQALSAAEQTVPEDRAIHSLHGYFLRRGDATTPIVYMVDPIRDGRSFTTRRVVAVQDGRAIFNLAASFQIAEPGFDHQDTMPEVPGPDGLKSIQELGTKLVNELPPEALAKIPDGVRAQATAPRPIELRPVRPRDPVAPSPSAPLRYTWCRAAGPLPDAPNMHAWLLAYASDFNFLVTALQPHGTSWLTRGMQIASVDHAMWFHRPVRMDQWLLYEVVSPSASGARGLVQGRYWTQDGRLVASTAQEGLIRDRRDG